VNTEQALPTDGNRGFWRIEKFFSEVLLYKVSRWLEVISGVSLLILAVISLVVVSFRRTPLAGPWLIPSIDLSEMFMALICLCAASICWYEGGHLRIDIIRGRVGPKAGTVMDLYAALAFLVFAVILTLGTWEKVAEIYHYHSTTWSARLPIIPWITVYFFAIVHFTIVLARSLVGLIAKLAGRLVEHDGLY
jgi:TRAP-type C4-dicarboxylate transport system permease small subunit